MLPIAAGVLGAFWGARVAKRRGGNRADMAQYAVGYGLSFLLVSYVLIMLADWLI